MGDKFDSDSVKTEEGEAVRDFRVSERIESSC